QGKAPKILVVACCDSRAAPEAVALPQAVAAMARGGSGAALPAPAPSLDRAAALAQYRLALIAEAQRYREYPRLALDNDWRGKVDVRMAVAANGALASLSVDRGSGHEVLDRQALEMIRKAKPRAPIPAALRGRDFMLDIPVIFELREPSA
ncbi:MAG: energy transducer TonB, partial [Betaproteobacteria bacterium]|nr:energy transducer TonB [Betaproteobacteria bacterium]